MNVGCWINQRPVYVNCWIKKNSWLSGTRGRHAHVGGAMLVSVLVRRPLRVHLLEESGTQAPGLSLNGGAHTIFGTKSGPISGFFWVGMD